MERTDLRNIAIIAHVDHGKTTLVDEMLKQSGTFRENQNVAERVMDSNDIERERGITILAKNASAEYNGVKINIVDTPGHADFGGEVERVLKMVNGVLLLVDAAEGPMPQTRFVLEKALQFNHAVIVVVNKIDKPDARIHEVVDEVLELLLDLGATDEQLDSPMVFCSGRNGTASYSPDGTGPISSPCSTPSCITSPRPGDDTAPLGVLVCSIDYNDFVGRIGIGRIHNGIDQRRPGRAGVRLPRPQFEPGQITSRLPKADGPERIEVQRHGRRYRAFGPCRRHHRQHRVRPRATSSRLNS